MTSTRVLVEAPWRTARIAVAIIITAGLTLPVAASGSGPTDAQRTLAYARCMRSHGVREWPDPNSSGLFPKRTPQQLAVSSSQLDAAQAACRRLFPNSAVPGGGEPTQAELRTMERDALSLARCMRSHGVPTWPDYTLRDGIPIFDLHGSTIAPNSPQIVAKQRACSSSLHISYVPPTSGGRA